MFPTGLIRRESFLSEELSVVFHEVLNKGTPIFKLPEQVLSLESTSLYRWVGNKIHWLAYCEFPVALMTVLCNNSRSLADVGICT